MSATCSDEAEKSWGSVPIGMSVVALPPPQVAMRPATSPSIVVVATTVTPEALPASAVGAGAASGLDEQAASRAADAARERLIERARTVGAMSRG